MLTFLYCYRTNRTSVTGLFTFLFVLPYQRNRFVYLFVCVSILLISPTHTNGFFLSGTEMSSERKRKDWSLNGTRYALMLHICILSVYSLIQAHIHGTTGSDTTPKIQTLQGNSFCFISWYKITQPLRCQRKRDDL